MILQLYINNYLFNEMSIPDEELINRIDFKKRVEEREERIKSYVQFMKASYFRAIAKCDSWYIVLVLRSRKFNEEKKYENKVNV